MEKGYGVSAGLNMLNQKIFFLHVTPRMFVCPAKFYYDILQRTPFDVSVNLSHSVDILLQIRLLTFLYQLFSRAILTMLFMLNVKCICFK